MAGRLLSMRGVRRALACGCLAAAGLVALPLLAVVAAINGIIPAVTGAGGNQVDAAQGILIGTAEPLPPGTFRVTQGFGCTAVASEPPPPRGYTCPPDAAHAGDTRFHTGIDLAAPIGVPVRAVVGGTVGVVDSAGGFGLHVLLSPAGEPGVVYLYGHLSTTTVAGGEVVAAGEVIGRVGSTGNSTGPHLHFEVDVGGRPENPCATFPPGYLVPAGVAASGCVGWELQ